MGTVSKMYMNVFNSIMARSMDYSWKANKMLAHVLPLRFPLVQKMSQLTTQPITSLL